MALKEFAIGDKRRRSFWRCAVILLGAAVALSWSAEGRAAPAVEGHPNFSGFWLLDQTLNRGPKTSPPDLPGGWRSFGTPNLPAPPLQKQVYEQFRARRAVEEGARSLDGGLDEQTARCDAGGFPDVMSFGDPLDIQQRDDEILMVTERDRQLPRHIYISPFHPSSDKYSPAVNGVFMHNGHSIAHWEGDTLVVHTDGFDPSPWMFSIERIPHSDAMTTMERITLSADGATLTDVMTIDDPKTLTQPWTLKYVWRRAPPETESFEGSCNIDFGFLGYVKK